MSNLKRRILRVAMTGAAALVFLIAPTLLMSGTSASSQAQCYNGIVPGNPYIQPCQSPQRRPKPPGGTADQWAVIACRDIPGCLSWYINHPH